MEANGLRFTKAGLVKNAEGSTAGERANQKGVTGSAGSGSNAKVRPMVADADSDITFDEYPVGTIVTDQYSDEGVLFSGPDANSPVYTAADGADPTSPALSGTPLFTGSVYGTFVEPGTSTPVAVDNFSIDVGYIDDPGSTQVLVYGTSGTQVLTADNVGYNTLTSTIGGVYSFVVEEDAGFDVDNLTFTPSDTPVTGLAGGPLVASETYGQSNPAEPLCSCSVGSQGDPVNTSTGNFTETYTDVNVGGKGPGLVLSRTYNSLAHATTGLFGYGWLSLYDMNVAVDTSSGDATVTQASGAQVTYLPTAAGFRAPTRVTATLTQNGDGTFTFITGHRVIYTFDSSGALTKISDLNGNAVTISHAYGGALSRPTRPAAR